MFYDILDWLSYWTAVWTISAVDWLQRTTQFAGEMFFNAIYILGQWFAAIRFYVMEYIRYAVEFEGTLIIKLHELLMVKWEFVKKLWTTWMGQIFYLCDHKWTRIRQVFTSWWEWVEEWFEDWVQFLVPLLEEHKTKIIYGLTDGWPKVWWFINDRWVMLFGTFERNIKGWEMFVDDPAQALWDWVEPRLQELVATFAVRIW